MKVIIAFIFGWLIPGAGHWIYNKKLKGIILFELVILALAIGLILSDFRSVRFYDNPFYYLARFGNGLVYIITALMTQFTPTGRIPLVYHDIGFLYIAVGGAINLIVLLSLFQSAEKAGMQEEHN